MKILITESQLKHIVEEYTSDEDYFELLSNQEYRVFSDIKNKTKITFPLINASQYKRALDEFVTHGEFLRFPVKYIYNWKDIMVENVVLLRVLTEVHGHSDSFPYDAFYDEFEIPQEEQTYDWGKCYEILDKYNIDDYVPYFSNGQPVLSDYGLRPLEKQLVILLGQNKPEDIIVTINKMLNIAHQRSDLSELFLEGGQISHYEISNT